MFHRADARHLSHAARVTIGFAESMSAWASAPALVTDGRLTILGHPVMEDWEAPYLERLATIASRNGGAVLELGFGLGISARAIQRHDIKCHLIVEANAHVYRRLEQFARAAAKPVEPLFGLWQDVAPSLPDGSVDGILFDTYPLREDEVHRNHFFFFREAYRLLKPGGVFTYYSDEIADLSALHRSRLHDAGFSSVEAEICPVSPPPSCVYWRSPTIVAPIVRK